MSLITVELMQCDGPQCSVECREQTPVGWITFHDVGGDYHLCTICAENEGNVKRQLYYQAMQRIDKKRGD